jgi:hypothetical protein
MAELRRRKTVEELKNDAIAELEQRGYDVRGKTPAQIRKLLRQPSKKRNSNETATSGCTDNRD